MQGQSYKYWAYVSYSHEDKLVCKRLHRFLEGFQIPSRLHHVQPEGSLSNSHLRPVFRDRDDLQSAGNLANSLQTALDASAALIVVCSPNAAGSKWVNEEIIHFIKAGRADRIFPIIVAGEPNSGDDCECFPPALQGEGELSIEPVAADARPDGDGWKDARLKLAAGLIGVGFDSLKQRSVKAQQRRLILATAFASAAAIGTSLLAIFAFNQQQIADIRRTQAEDLVSFMLGDLRERLAEVGRLDILDAVGEQADDYFSMVPPQELNDVSLEKQALAMRQIGEVRLYQGAFDEATTNFEASLASWQQLVERAPDNDSYLFELGQSQFWVGYVHRERSDIRSARAFFNDYLSTSIQLAEKFSGESRYLMELLYAQSNLGTLATETGDSEGAVQYFREAERIGENLIAIDPENLDYQLEQAATISWLGRLAQDSWRLGEAVSYEQRSEEILRQITDTNPDFYFGQELHAVSCSALASQHWYLGKMQEAQKFLMCGLETLEGLTQHDPDNQFWAHQLLFLQVLQLRLDWARGESADTLFQQVSSNFNAVLADDSHTRASDRLYAHFVAASMLQGKAVDEPPPNLWPETIEWSRDELTARCHLEAAYLLTDTELQFESICASETASRLSINAAGWQYLIHTKSGLPDSKFLANAEELKQPDILVWMSD